MSKIHIRPLAATPALIETLAGLLSEVVAQGGSVGFMHPLADPEARSFWERALQAAADGQRIVFGAFDDDQLVATVSLLLDCPPNQPHRAEIAKMMTLPRCRGRGIAAALLRTAEAAAMERGKTLLVLDTASEGGAAGLYEKHGFTLTGEIPDFALKPYGGLTGTLLYWKRIGMQHA
ncbi:GNAT family N-acetyltransferase [Massilia violaceinigra]|uniref:GNAT family N-acetyltransferase n=1 Tax=Massilia violaceinigra TaxID=2045208 RepID=A0ABY4A2Z0_9BURK|nr:GNAT family N-acetyltransferase [Massilia violaceinigra]UOD29117.1 GNAT family N-acetyltransferase [Massilia violaceinigra]